MILVIDNYDSFTYNLVQYFGELGAELCVVRNDQIALDEVRALGPSHIVISPGPSRPEHAGISVELIGVLGPTTPILGVCLGHQAIGVAYGGDVIQVEPVHGKKWPVEHTGSGVFAGLPDPLLGGRYHSLVVETADLPGELVVTARSEEGEIMALRHREHPIVGVQLENEYGGPAEHLLTLKHLAQEVGGEDQGAVDDGDHHQVLLGVILVQLFAESGDPAFDRQRRDEDVVEVLEFGRAFRGGHRGI